jgi:putative oxidoreductase
MERETMAAQTRYFIPALGGVYERLGEFGWAFLRIVYGAWYIPHGMQKLFGMWGGNVEALAKTIESKVGWSPGMFWAYTIGSLEFFGGILLVLGLLTRPVAVGFIIFMYVAAFHFNNQFGWWWTKAGMEMPLLLLGIGIAILIRGGGAYSLDRKIGREF